MQADGSVLLGGSSYLPVGNNYNWKMTIAKLKSDGSMDNAFDGDGIGVYDFGSYAYAYGIALQSDGKILATGYAYDGQSIWGRALLRVLNDGTAYSLSAPANQQANASGCNAVVNNLDATVSPAGAAYSYALSGATTGSGSGSVSGMSFAIGVTTVTYTLDADPTKTASFTVTVNDVTAPAITQPSTMVVANETGKCTASVDFSATVTDCSSFAVKYYLQYGTPAQEEISFPKVFAVGTYAITIEAKDAAANTATTAFTISVEDREAPVPNVTTLADATGECSVTVSKPTATDNCVGTVTASTSDPLSYTAQGEYTITWTYDDGNGNTSTQTQKVVVKDVTPPSFTTSPANTTVNCDGSTAPASTGTAAASDNCTANPTVTYSDVSTQDLDPGKAAHYNYTITRTWTAEDAVGLKSTYVQTITVQDIAAPVITCPSNILDVPFDFNQLYATINIGTASATDNCAQGANITITSNKPANNQYPLGSTTVKWTATDPSSNATDCNQTLTVRKRRTQVVYTGDVNSSGQVDVQYSDIISLRAKLTDNEGLATPNNISGRTLTFQLLSSTNVVVRTKTVQTNASGEATDTLKVEQAPGTYSVRVLFAGDDYFSSSQDSDPCIVRQENADFVYSGSLYFTTPSASNNTGTVVLTTSINDVSDGADRRGDIRKARVTFTNGSGGSVLGTANAVVGLVTPGVLTDGLASTSFSYSLNTNEQSGGGRTWDVWTRASDHYTGEAGPTPVTLALPGQDFVTGGGSYIMQNSAGTYAGSANARMNFGFTMKWNRSGRNLQGQVNVVFRRWQLFQGVMQWRVYQIKSNAINSMSVRTEGGFSKAVINTKANLTDVTDPLNTISYGGGHDLTLEAWDHTTANGGTMDRIGVMLVGNGTSELLFASSWASSALQIQQINGGNINVRSNSAAAPVAPAVTKQNVENGKATDNATTTLQADVYPNPSSQHFTIRIQSDKKDVPIQLRVSDVSGRVLKVFDKLQPDELIRLGENFKAGTYFIEVWQGQQRRMLKVIKL